MTSKTRVAGDNGNNKKPVKKQAFWGNKARECYLTSLPDACKSA